MIANGTYELELTYQKKEIDLSMENISFIVQESIHELYPKMSLEINDVTGILSEYLFGVEGSELELYFKLTTEEDGLLCPFTFVDNNLSNISNNSTLGGVLKYRLVHSASFKQSVISSAYDDRISGIVNDKLSTYGFSTININDTGNQDIWYQPNKKDLEFIKNDLLPYAYSNNSDNTPFYFYIDATNTANFINYKTIKNNILNFKLTYGRQSENDELIAPLSIEKLTLGSKATKDLRYIKGIGLNLDGGIEEIEEQLISDIYSSKQGKSPVIFDPSIITKIIEMDEELEKGKQENNQGYLINLLAKVIGLEQFIVTIPYNSYVRAGTSIDFITNDSGKEFNPSINYTDNYIIEEVSSLWNGKIGLTKFIMSRNNLALDPSEFLIYNELGG